MTSTSTTTTLTKLNPSMISPRPASSLTTMTTDETIVNQILTLLHKENTVGRTKEGREELRKALDTYLSFLTNQSSSAYLPLPTIADTVNTRTVSTVDKQYTELFHGILNSLHRSYDDVSCNILDRVWKLWNYVYQRTHPTNPPNTTKGETKETFTFILRRIYRQFIRLVETESSSSVLPSSVTTTNSGTTSTVISFTVQEFCKWLNEGFDDPSHFILTEFNDIGTLDILVLFIRNIMEDEHNTHRLTMDNVITKLVTKNVYPLITERLIIIQETVRTKPFTSVEKITK